MSFKYIRAGDRIDIFEKSSAGRMMNSQVEDILEPAGLLIKAPGGRLADFPGESGLRALVFTDIGIFEYNAYVVEKVSRNGSNLLHVSLPGEGERVQRREFYRLNCALPFCFKKVANANAPFNASGGKTGLILDISGGGIRFVSGFPLGRNSLIKGNVDLDGESALIAGKVIFAQRIRSEEANLTLQYRAHYVNLPDGVLDIIIRYVLNGQRKQLQCR